jgi:putative flippase GtrA
MASRVQLVALRCDVGVAIGAAVVVNYLAESLLTWRVLQ